MSARSTCRVVSSHYCTRRRAWSRQKLHRRLHSAAKYSKLTCPLCGCCCMPASRWRWEECQIYRSTRLKQDWLIWISHTREQNVDIGWMGTSFVTDTLHRKLLQYLNTLHSTSCCVCSEAFFVVAKKLLFSPSHSESTPMHAPLEWGVDSMIEWKLIKLFNSVNDREKLVYEFARGLGDTSNIRS